MPLSKERIKAIYYAGAFAVLVLGVLFYVVIKIIASGRDVPTAAERFYWKEDPGLGDLVTKVPSLRDMIRGPIITAADPSAGDPAAPVVLVIYSDHLCEFCSEIEDDLLSLVEEYGGRVRLVYKDYPERATSSLSYQTAVAARCAGDQDRFWEYRRALAEDQPQAPDDLATTGRRVGLDGDDLEACRTSGEAFRLVEENIEEADALGIMGVPFLFVNDQEVMGRIGRDEIKAMIEEELMKINDN